MSNVSITSFCYNQRLLIFLKSILIVGIQYAKKKSTQGSHVLISELGLTEELLKTFRNTQLYQYGPGRYLGLPEYDEIVILFSDDIKNELYNNSIWCVDGTFSVSPAGFNQVFTIGIIRDHHVIPIVYAGGRCE